MLGLSYKVANRNDSKAKSEFDQNKEKTLLKVQKSCEVSAYTGLLLCGTEFG